MALVCGCSFIYTCRIINAYRWLSTEVLLLRNLEPLGPQNVDTHVFTAASTRSNLDTHRSSFSGAVFTTFLHTKLNVGYFSHNHSPICINPRTFQILLHGYSCRNHFYSMNISINLNLNRNCPILRCGMSLNSN